MKRDLSNIKTSQSHKDHLGIIPLVAGAIAGAVSGIAGAVSQYKAAKANADAMKHQANMQLKMQREAITHENETRAKDELKRAVVQYQQIYEQQKEYFDMVLNTSLLNFSYALDNLGLYDEYVSRARTAYSTLIGNYQSEFEKYLNANNHFDTTMRSHEEMLYRIEDYYDENNPARQIVLS